VADLLDRIADARLVAVLRVPSVDLVEPAVAALEAGGVAAIELTFTTPGIAAELERTRARHPQLLLGAGTIRTGDQARAAAVAGVDFLVSPHLDLALLEACLATGVAAIPGVLTPSEVAVALAAGAELLKLFPAGSVGPDYLKSLYGPFPGIRVVPTGGIGLAEARQWLDAGAAAVGVGGELCPPALIEAGRFPDLTENARLFREALG
jgi:2-dehydro-3-deoxyphosphogluconate aldolase / (4S)-4-hydroxy-2-oxoglutarate aldolase